MRVKIRQKQALINLIRQKQLLVHFSILIIAVSVLLLPDNYSNHELRAQPFYSDQPSTFDENIVLNLGLPMTPVETFGVIIVNENTGAKATNFYNDYGVYPREGTIRGFIEASVGDTLSICVMDMQTEQIACNSQTADYDGSPTEFYVDMNTAQSVSGFSYGQIGEDDTQGAEHQCSCEVCDTGFSGQKDFTTLPKVTQIVDEFDSGEGDWKPHTGCPNQG